jgi:hypothetical protein
VAAPAGGHPFDTGSGVEVLSAGFGAPRSEVEALSSDFGAPRSGVEALSSGVEALSFGSAVAAGEPRQALDGALPGLGLSQGSCSALGISAAGTRAAGEARVGWGERERTPT